MIISSQVWGPNPTSHVFGQLVSAVVVTAAVVLVMMTVARGNKEVVVITVMASAETMTLSVIEIRRKMERSILKISP